MTKRLKQTNYYPSIVAWLKSYLDIFDSSGKAYCDMLMIVGYHQFEWPSATDFDWPAISNETISIHAIFLTQICSRLQLMQGPQRKRTLSSQQTRLAMSFKVEVMSITEILSCTGLFNTYSLLIKPRLATLWQHK